MCSLVDLGAVQGQGWAGSPDPPASVSVVSRTTERLASTPYFKQFWEMNLGILVSQSYTH